MAIVKFNPVVSGITPNRQLGKVKGKSLEGLPSHLRAVWKAGVFPAENIRFIGTTRKAIADALYRHGTISNDGAYRTSEEVAPEALKEARAIERKFNKDLDKLLVDWEQVCINSVTAFERELMAHPERHTLSQQFGYESVDEMVRDLTVRMRASQPSAKRVKHDVWMYVYVEVNGELQSDDKDLLTAIGDTEKRVEEDLLSSLLKDTVKAADEIFTLLTKAEDGQALNRRTLSKAQKLLIDKVRSLAYVDKRLYSLAAGAEAVLSPLTSIETSKTIRIGECGDLIALLAVLSNEKRLLARLDALEDGQPLLPVTAKREFTVVVDEEDKEEEVASSSEVTADTDSDADVDTALVDDEEEVAMNWG